MGYKSKKNGDDFEKRMCEYLSKNGYYVIYNEKGVTGSQCCDLNVIKNNKATLIECKNLDNKSGKFPLSRIESNQFHAYKKYRECGNTRFVLAIQWNNAVYIYDFGLIVLMKDKIKSIDLKEVQPNWRWSDESLS